MGGGEDGAASSHDLTVKRRFSFVVSHASRTLTRQLNSALQQRVLGKHKHLVPAEDVEAILARDHRSSALPYTLYIINPCLSCNASALPGGVPERLPRYWYQSEHFPGTCVAPMWQSVLYRFAWVDLAAGPPSWGPRTLGSGLVTAPALPSTRPPPPGSAGDGSGTDLLPARIATFVHQTTQMLLSPPIMTHPVPFRPIVDIRIVVLVDGPTPPSSTRRPRQDSGFVEFHELDFSVVNLGDWMSLLPALGHVARVTGQEVKASLATVYAAECRSCLAALADSSRGYTSHLVSGGVTTRVHKYLDSKALGSWFRKPAADMVAALGDSNTLVVPVFVVDSVEAGEQPVLLDRHHQAVRVDAGTAVDQHSTGTGAGRGRADGTGGQRGDHGAAQLPTHFPGLVLAVKSHSPHTGTDFECNGNALEIVPDDPRRATLGAILQVAWGVAPTHELWDTLTESVANNYMWSTGATPFGPFSSSLHLSFAVVDAAARNMVLSALDSVLAEVVGLLEHFDSFQVGLDDALTPDEHLEFIRRWNFFRYKWMRVSTLVHLHNFDGALEYTRSMQQDSHALHRLVHAAGRKLATEVLCAALQAKHGATEPHPADAPGGASTDGGQVDTPAASLTVWLLRVCVVAASTGAAIAGVKRAPRTVRWLRLKVAQLRAARRAASVHRGSAATHRHSD